MMPATAEAIRGSRQEPMDMTWPVPTKWQPAHSLDFMAARIENLASSWALRASNQ